ncbi:MAG: HEAT repeat domain-containing protein [bacterium]|nr:HEAT repeat domain-containing protein [bacterium]
MKRLKIILLCFGLLNSLAAAHQTGHKVTYKYEKGSDLLKLFPKGYKIIKPVLTIFDDNQETRFEFSVGAGIVIDQSHQGYLVIKYMDRRFSAYGSHAFEMVDLERKEVFPVVTDVIYEVETGRDDLLIGVQRIAKKADLIFDGTFENADNEYYESTNVLFVIKFDFEAGRYYRTNIVTGAHLPDGNLLFERGNEKGWTRLYSVKNNSLHYSVDQCAKITRQYPLPTKNPTLKTKKQKEKEQSPEINITAIKKSLKAHDYQERIQAAKRLKKIKDKSSLKPLINAMWEEENGDVRYHILLAIVALKDPETVKIVSQKLRDKDPEIRLNAAWILKWLGDKKAVQPLLKSITDQDESVQEAVTGALVKLGDKSIITHLLQDKNPEIRCFAVSNLGDKENKHAVDLLLQCLEANEENIRSEAAQSLGYTENKKAVVPLIKMLNDKSNSVREAAVISLGKLDDPGAVMPLIKLLDNKSVCEAVIESLGKLKDARAVMPLTRLLKDEESYRTVVDALMEIGDKRATGPLLAFLKYEDLFVRRAAAFALEELGDHRIVEPFIVLLEKDISPGLIVALGRFKSQRLVEPLLSVLERENGFEIRNETIKLLGELKSLKAEDLLIKNLGDCSFYIRIAVVETLGKIKSKKAVEPLILLFKTDNNYVREKVAEALGDIGAQRAIEVLRAASQDENIEVRKAVIKALAKLKRLAAATGDILCP